MMERYGFGSRVMAALLVLCLLVACVPGTALAAEGDESVQDPSVLAAGQCGEALEWTLYQDGLLKITGQGDMEMFSSYSGQPWADYRDQITSVDIEDGITSIGNYAFAQCTQLKEAVIPETVASIGTYAFQYCCSLLRVELPMGLTSIEDATFRECYELQEVNIPSTVRRIGDSAFGMCMGLTKIDLPEKLTTIDNAAFSFCSKLETVRVPRGVGELGMAAFCDCTSLTSVELEGVGIIGAVAFSQCKALRRISLPKALWSVGESAFCSAGLQTVEYAGSKDSWAKVMIGSDNAPLLNATFIYAEDHEHNMEMTIEYATCTEDGLQTRKCTICGYTETQVIKAYGHEYDSVRTDPSCTKDGSVKYSCKYCVHRYSEPIPAVGHSFSGGVCTVCGEKDPDWAKDPGLVLSYPTLSFEDEIIYNVYYTVEDMTSVVEMGLMLLPSMMPEATMDDAIATVPGYVTNGVAYLVSSDGIPAAQMGDTIYFKVYAKLRDGSYAYSEAGGYNAKAYASSVLDGDYPDDMKRLVVAMLAYGAEAQRYFGEDEALMDEVLTQEHRALVEAYDPSMMDDVVKADASKTGGFVRDNSNFKSLYPSVSFEGAFAINFYCVPAIAVDGAMTLYWWDVETMEAVDELTVDNAVGSVEMTTAGGIWWGQVPGIAAKDMDKTYYMTCVFESEGETVTTGIIPYSLGKYCQEKAAADGDPQQDFAKATAVYGYYAKCYFTSEN